MGVPATADRASGVSGDPAGGGFAIACLSPQPWAVDLPTNRQQIMLRAAGRGHPVLFVETGAFVGRSLAQLVRGPGRRSVLRRLLVSEPVGDGIRAIAALNILPWGHRFRFAARVNARLTSRRISRATRRWSRLVLWLYDPCFADAIGHSGERLAVYDCVDDYAQQTGDDARKRATVEWYDTLAASRARVVFATATLLFERHRRVNERTHLVRNVGDYAHFLPASDRGFVCPELAGLRSPVIGFAGNFLANKVDFALVAAIAQRNPAWTLLLVGPARAEAAAGIDALTALDNVCWTGLVSYAELPRFIAAFDVGLIPYLENEYTRSCFPLKLYEYLAAGKPVVATGLPELRGLEPHVVVTEGADGTVAAIERALTTTGPGPAAERQAVARENTWETRAARLLELVADEL